MNQFKLLLLEFSETLSKVNKTLFDLLEKGLQREAILSETKELPLSLPEEVLTFYEWRNGLNKKLSAPKKVGELEIVSLGIFSSLGESIKAYKFYALENSYWPKHYFPLLDSGGGDFYLIDCNAAGGDYGMMWLYCNSLVQFNGFVTTYDSLERLFTSTIECFRQGAYTYKPALAENENSPQRSYLEINDALEAKICKQNNPRSEYWKMFE